jgi:hypothetical protein
MYKGVFYKCILLCNVCIKIDALGFGIVFPYMTLLMRHIGLTIEEISFINGICPAIIVFVLPILGNYRIQCQTALSGTAKIYVCKIHLKN